MEDMEWMELLNQQNQLENVMKANLYTSQFGLQLSPEDAKMLFEERKENLKKQERIEFGEGILSKLIFAFCDSPYIYQDNYVESLERLQEIFYLYKNESLDEITDDELISFKRKEFNGICQGSFDYLEDTSLEKFARSIRQNTHRFIGKYEDDDEEL